MLMPQSGHAKFCENVICSPSTISTMALPSVSSNTFSSESVSLFSMPGFTTRRSTTMSILCFIFFSIGISSESSYMLPSTITRTYPLFLVLSNSFWCSPLRPLTTGARSWIRVRSGSAITASTIWSIVCLVMARPHFGQCGIPMRA